MNVFAMRNFERMGEKNRLVLLLTTTGRRTGKAIVTPLQYEFRDGHYYVASGRGWDADWLKNIRNDPRVQITARGVDYLGTGRIITDPAQVADFLEYRIRQRPFMMKVMLLFEGMPWNASREEMRTFATKKVMVEIIPD
jgi:deazaflavin-dependent oxidoreductase (nitroreductase family)